MPGKKYPMKSSDYTVKPAGDRSGMMSMKTQGRGGRMYNETMEEKMARFNKEQGY